MNKTFFNLFCALFVAWTMFFCGFWYFFEMERSALFASLSLILTMLVMFQPDTVTAKEPEADAVLRHMKKQCENQGLSLKTYKKVNGKWVQQ